MSKKLNKNISMLRFPEFAGKWEIKKLGDICDCIVPGRNKPKTFNGNIPWITTPDIEHGRINVFSASLKISYEEAQSIGSKVVPKGSVLMSCVGELGITAITDCEIVINQQLHAFIPNDLINKYFLFYGIKTQKKYIESIATKTAVPYLNKNNCNSISIPLPSIAEQEKIASFLGAIDKRLTQLRRKHELLQTYKRGVMQKIFSQEVRFKGAIGSEFPDWEKKKLGELGEVIAGLTYSPSDVRKEGLLVLRSSNVQDGKLAFDDCVFVNKVIDSKSLSREGDILICVRNGSTNLIGKNALISKNIPPSTHGAFMVVFRSNRSSFIFQLFQTAVYKRQVYQDLGARINSINSDRLRKYRFLIPCVEEQEKIANFLTAIDRKIEVVAQQINRTEQFKKGLLQKMFV